MKLPRPRHTREKPRPRHGVGPKTLLVLRPVYRYSRVRDAYVLRVVGRRHGPVLKLVRKPTGQAPRPRALA